MERPARYERDLVVGKVDGGQEVVVAAAAKEFVGQFPESVARENEHLSTVRGEGE